MSPRTQAPLDPNGPTSPTDELVASTVPAISMARVLLVLKEHGIVAALVLMMAYQIGFMSQAQSFMCGV